MIRWTMTGKFRNVLEVSLESGQAHTEVAVESWVLSCLPYNACSLVRPMDQDIHIKYAHKNRVGCTIWRRRRKKHPKGNPGQKPGKLSDDRQLLSREH